MNAVDRVELESQVNQPALAIKTPLIFTVHCFQPVGDSKFKLDVHYVAGYDSLDAEERIIACEGGHLAGRRFITADRFMEDNPRPTRMYATRYSNEDSLSGRDLDKWVDQMTNDPREDGDTYPAAFREF